MMISKSKGVIGSKALVTALAPMLATFEVTFFLKMQFDSFLARKNSPHF